jgi:phosphoribosylglycinamide formyltransferase-1
VEVIINIAVLASGSGTNLQALIDAPDLRGDIGLVLSDRANAAALDRARGAGIPTKILPWGDYRSRSEFSTAIKEEIEMGDVHFVDEEVDHGPIIAQRAVPVLSDDDRDSLHARIQVEEHDLYPKVVAALARGEITVEGRKVRWD